MLVLALAAALVAGAALSTPDAEAKKKKKINVVQCAGLGQRCDGTERSYRLVGTIFGENISGGEGNDVYEGNGGDASFSDSSPTSGDTYQANGADDILRNGGKSDFLDLGFLMLGDDLGFIRQNNNLVLDGPGGNDVFIERHFGVGRIEKIKFANATITCIQAQSLAREVSEEEQAKIEERASQDEKQATATPEKE